MSANNMLCDLIGIMDHGNIDQVFNIAALILDDHDLDEDGCSHRAITPYSGLHRQAPSPFGVLHVMSLPVDPAAPSLSPLLVSAGGVRLFIGSSLVRVNHGLNRRRSSKLPKPEYLMKL